jgi:hypothetical protein
VRQLDLAAVVHVDDHDFDPSPGLTVSTRST